MLEASDFETINDVSPFLGYPVDSFSGLNETGEITGALTEYVGMDNFLYWFHIFLNGVPHQASSNKYTFL